MSSIAILWTWPSFWSEIVEKCNV